MGGNFFYKFIMGRGKGCIEGFGCRLIFFLTIFTVEGGGGWRLMFFFFNLHLTCGRRKGKGQFYLFHCGVARDRGSRVFFVIC
jgi:hypothetical protein